MLKGLRDIFISCQKFQYNYAPGITGLSKYPIMRPTVNAMHYGQSGY